MLSPETLLRDLGLTPAEITVYRAGLAAGPSAAGALAKTTRLKRPTVYHALHELVAKGLCAKTGTGAKLLFTMAHPERLKGLAERELERLKARQKEIDSLLPALVGPLAATGATVIQYDGVEGVKTAVEEALYCRSRRWDILAPSKNFFSQVEPEYATYYLNAREARGITSRSLWEKDPSRRVHPPGELKAREPRILPAAMHGTFTSVLILFDDAALFIPPLAAASAVLIRSKDVHRTLSAMFEGLWAVSTPYGR